MTATLTTATAQCVNVDVVYGSGDRTLRALAGVSFAVAPRESVALLGRSGSGKTTLLHLLGGLVEPTSGKVFWQGQPLSSLDRAARGAVRARGLAFVFQNANLLPNFTARENVAFAAFVSGQHGRNVEPQSLLDLVGLRSKGDQLPGELSGGEAQRVAVARALAQEPRLLLCDEPTGHLDSDTAARVLDLLFELQSRFGFALVLATHDESVAARLERQVELLDGRLLRESHP